MAGVSDTELSAYVELHDCCIQDQEVTVVTKGNELLRSSKSATHVHDVSPADDSQKIAKDAFGVLQAFEDISGEIGVTNDAAVKKQWDDNYKKYRTMLENTVKLAEQGSKYIQSFYDKVIANLSNNGSDWQNDKKLIADFIKNDKEGEKFIEQITNASQEFTNLKYSTQAFHQTYADNANKKGQAYNAKLKEMDDNRRNIQSQIDSNRASSSQLRSSMRRTAGPGFFFGWLVRTVLSLLGVNAFNQANSRVAELEREEQELVKKRAAIDNQADSLAKQESALIKTRHAVSVVADNVSDISGRLTGLAETWSGIRFSFVKLGIMLENVGYSTSQETFMARIQMIKESTSSLKDNFQSYINGVAPGGVIPQPVKKKPPTYDISQTEYISAAWGKSGRADNGQPWYGDCIHQLTLEITDAATGAKRNTATFGLAFKLSPAATTNISWRGRLLGIAGTANNNAPQVGLRGIKFIHLSRIHQQLVLCPLVRVGHETQTGEVGNPRSCEAVRVDRGRPTAKSGSPPERPMGFEEAGGTARRVEEAPKGRRGGRVDLTDGEATPKAQGCDRRARPKWSRLGSEGRGGPDTVDPSMTNSNPS
ncbi:hypothetical protein RHS01_08657 [Rhizoctonia solani]|uniref:Uncharacterized protein n=1 Tax=Rhizoctonia solani TaxID=456999 RepID=A0A8H7I4Q7_9AGAM|nr:hypothetical protein RHS01_08657 [Rhizoctonia solani]